MARLGPAAMSAMMSALGGNSGLDMLTSSSSGHDPELTQAERQSRSAAVTAVVRCAILSSSHAREGLGSETARVHHPSRRRGGMAARRARAAAEQIADYRIPGHRRLVILDPMDHCVCTAAA